MITPKLAVVDLGDTLGQSTGDSIGEVLRKHCLIGQVNPKVIGEVCRAILHREPRVTEDVIQRVCDRLAMDRKDWPHEFPVRGYRPFPDANAALERLNDLGLKVVVLSNLSVIGGRERVRAAMDHHGEFVHRFYASYLIGGRKPEPWLWGAIADDWEVPVASVVHVGNQLVEDVLGPLRAGAQAIHLTTSPGIDPRIQGRIEYHTAPTLSCVVDRIEQMVRKGARA